MDQITQRMIERQVDIMRYELGLQNEMQRRLDNLRDRIETRLAGLNLTELSKTQLNSLLEWVENEIDACYRDFEMVINENLKSLAVDESKFLEILFAGLAAGTLLQEFLIGGLTVEEALGAQKINTINGVKRKIRTAAIDGVKCDFKSVFKRAEVYSKSFIPTAVSAVRNQIAYTAGELNPLVEGWRHVSVLDDHTSSVCAVRNGLIWDSAHEPVDHDLVFQVPPLHYNCRSQLVLITDLQAARDAPRSSIDDWVKSRSLQSLQAQFGVVIGRFLKNGTLKLSDIIKNGGLEPMTLAEVRLKYRDLK